MAEDTTERLQRISNRIWAMDVELAVDPGLANKVQEVLKELLTVAVDLHERVTYLQGWSTDHAQSHDDPLRPAN